MIQYGKLFSVVWAAGEEFTLQGHWERGEDGQLSYRLNVRYRGGSLAEFGLAEPEALYLAGHMAQPDLPEPPALPLDQVPRPGPDPG